MSKSLLIVNPAADFPTYFGAEVLAATGLTPGIMMADLTSVTVAALAPPDFHVQICDESIEPIDYDHPADWIAVTGKLSQKHGIVRVADEFRRRGKKVLIGGPFASLSSDLVRDHCDVLVRGEAEEIAGELFADLRAGKPKSEYVGGKPDLAISPLPRWDLYRNDRAVLGALQTSRGCPFECEFCDVIQYLGRKQRHKPIARVLEEIDQLYDAGYRLIFLADDNLTAYRSRCKELLQAIAHKRKTKPVSFVTQVSIDVTRDEELLRMLPEAGVTQVFIGIETPNLDSLRETGKRQNLRIDMVSEVQKLVDHGISVMGGMIVGFDSDGPDVFRAQYEFSQKTPIPMFSLGGLVAVDQTPLKARIEREGRLFVNESRAQGVPWASNIRPVSMTMQELDLGLQGLSNAMYSPEAFGERMERFIGTFGRSLRDASPGDFGALRDIDKDTLRVALNVRSLGEAENRMWTRVWNAARRNPHAIPIATRMLVQYAQVRHMYDKCQYWEPHLASIATTPNVRVDALVSAGS